MNDLLTSIVESDLVLSMVWNAIWFSAARFFKIFNLRPITRNQCLWSNFFCELFNSCLLNNLNFFFFIFLFTLSFLLFLHFLFLFLFGKYLLVYDYCGFFQFSKWFTIANQKSIGLLGEWILVSWQWNHISRIFLNQRHIPDLLIQLIYWWMIELVRNLNVWMFVLIVHNAW